MKVSVIISDKTYFYNIVDFTFDNNKNNLIIDLKKKLLICNGISILSNKKLEDFKLYIKNNTQVLDDRQLLKHNTIYCIYIDLQNELL